MDVIDNRTRSIFEFRQLHTGCVFEHNRTTYIKVAGSSDMNAVGLSSGVAADLRPDALVTVLDAAVHIS